MARLTIKQWTDIKTRYQGTTTQTIKPADISPRYATYLHQDIPFSHRHVKNETGAIVYHLHLA